jgi:hypothetical protein
MQVNGNSFVAGGIDLQETERQRKAREAFGRAGTTITEVQDKLTSLAMQEGPRLEGSVITIQFVNYPNRMGTFTAMEERLRWAEDDLNAFPEFRGEWQPMYNRLYGVREHLARASDEAYARTINTASRILRVTSQIFRFFSQRDVGTNK